MVENKKETPKNPNLEEAREHFHAARDAMHKSIDALMPEGFRENRRSAHKEVLLGMRKMLDAAIVHVEKQSTHD